MKKSGLLLTLVMLLLPMVAAADSYTSLWKQYDTAVNKDHPQTALKILSQIARKASSERAYGQLLKAQTVRIKQVCNVSPDSLQPEAERLRNSEQAATASGDHVMAAIYQSVLGKMYTDNSRLIDDGEAIGRAWLAKSMSNPDALAAAYTTTYEPFVVDGIDSKYYYDDLLHIIAMRAGDYRALHDYYAAHGKREGALLSALELVRRARRAGDEGHVKKSRYIMSLDSLVRQYGDLLPCGEAAIERYAYMENAEDVTAEDKMKYINYALMKWGAWPRMNILRNAQRRLTLPSFHVSLGGTMALPGITRRVVVMGATNIGELRITATRLDIDGTKRLDPTVDKEYAQLRRHIVQGEQPIGDVRRYMGLPAWRTVSDTLSLEGLRPGVYLVEVAADNVSVPAERRLLHVCNIYPVAEALPGGRVRMAVLDATTGVPVPDAKIDLYGDDLSKVLQTLTCDANGEAVVDSVKARNTFYRVYTAADRAFPTTPLSGRFFYYGSKGNAEQTHTALYTDRSLYRPGQTVHAAAIVYTYNNKVYRGQAKDAQTVTLTLRDANRREVARHTATTDSYGMASADFALPSSGLTGTYTLQADCGTMAYTSFNVEEYRRPTFSVDIAPATAKYAAGDTVRLDGTTRTFAGMAVQNARAVVRVVRRPAMFWRATGSDMRHETVMCDTVRTAADGTFAIKVPITIPDTYDEQPRRYYTFDVTADITDAAGETQSATTSLPYSDRPTMLTADVPDKSLRDSLRTITFAYINNAGQPVDATVAYTIDGHRYTCKANSPATINSEALLSGRHSLTAVCGTDTLNTEFTTFTLQDRRAPIETHDWFWQSADRFKDASTPVYIQVGSTDSIQHVMYTVLSADRIIEQGRADLKNELRTRAIKYRDEWGDGIVLSLTWVHNGQAYCHTARIERPLPETRLNLKWTTFRDRLTPGQRESWTLNITRPDGTPAKAQLMAMMYDKSLDKIRRHRIGFGLPAYANVPWLSWHGVSNANQTAYSEMPMRFLDEPRLRLSRFADYEGIFPMNEALVARPEVYSSMMLERSSMAMPEAPAMGSMKTKALSKMRYSDNATADKAIAGAAEQDEDSDAPTGNGGNVQMRENLSETAFFYPGLVSDDRGNVAIQFTLPESVTTWQFYGLAHDRDMNNAIIAATSVAKKTIMVQPNVPRFVRSADRGNIQARIANTSDKTQTGTARLAFVNPETGKEVYHAERKFSVKAGETATASFDFDMAKIANDGLLICRVTAQGRGYSDGEQHYLPVLPDRELVTNTVAFTQNQPGTLSIDIDKLFGVKDRNNRLTVEYTDNPAWLMIQTLPTAANADGDNAMSLASAYYATAVGRRIMLASPAIKPTIEQWQKETAQADGATSLQSALQKNSELRLTMTDETPWLTAAARETEQKQMLAAFFDASQTDYRLADCMQRLKRLQREDGSFAWWKGMDGSPYMTMGVLQTLVRTSAITGDSKATASLISAAFGYMDRQMAREVKEMKKLESKDPKHNATPSETAMQYMYATVLAKRSLKASAQQNFDYLVSRLARQNTQPTIYGKAVAAIVLAKTGHTRQAAELMESIRQYTVYDDATGRYFDTPKAQYSWFDYRIPTQVAAIEALKALQPDDTQTIAEMQRWLLQAKRTQAWDTPLNTVGAVYAFLGDNACQLAADSAQPATLKIDGQKLPAPKATAGLGYQKAATTGAHMRTFTAEKTSAGTSWGAVYAQYMQPTADVADAAQGMSVKREIMTDGRKVDANGVQLHVGDRITVRITVVADRDYDFVHIADRRAACLEPAEQLSGYACGYYCQPKDNATNYFFDRMAKGRHVIETTYYADRAGQYTTGTCAVQCAYSPEFMARTKAITLDVTE